MRLGILVIDDEEGIRRSLTRILKEEGYSVYTAEDGEKGLNIIKEATGRVDIVICDLIMPGIDGIKTIEEITKIHRDATKIILTGYGTLESSIKAIEAGIDGFITKPFENKEIKWKIKECYVKRRMKQFIPPEIFNKLLNEPSHLEHRLSHLTILFSDIRGFTKISSTISPGELASLLNRYYFEPLSEIVVNHRGIVDKYIGDSIMALFGAPIYQDRHEEDAVRCAIEMIEKTKQIGRGLEIGIGISTGYAVTGIFGSMNKKEYTAMGMPVNIAARLQKIAAPGEIIISEETKSGIDDGIPFEKVGLLSLLPNSMPTVYYRWTGNGQV
ncbi:MAG: response regulator [Syntrophorhabdaceae bacterium]|nr:response regulator [Syntrophorhabdaceae bacterium]